MSGSPVLRPMLLGFALAAAAAGAACKVDPPGQAVTDDSTLANHDPGGASRPRFRLETGDLTPAALIAALNKAPKPIGTVDLLASLPGPVNLTLTTSARSPQPGLRKKSNPCEILPRAIVGVGQKMTVTTTLADERNRDAIFLSFKSRAGGRLYMSLGMPITGELSVDAVMARGKSKGDTKGCSDCHDRADKKPPENSSWLLAAPLATEASKIVGNDTVSELVACARREASDEQNADALKRVMFENALRLEAILEVGVVP